MQGTAKAKHEDVKKKKRGYQNHKMWGKRVKSIGFFFFFKNGFPGDSAGKESICNAGDLGSIPGLGRMPGEGNGYPLQYSGLENSMHCMVLGVT